MLPEIKLTQALMFSAAETKSPPLCTPLTRAELTRGANLCHMCPAERTVSPTVARSSAQTWPRGCHYTTKQQNSPKHSSTSAPKVPTEIRAQEIGYSSTPTKPPTPEGQGHVSFRVSAPRHKCPSSLQFYRTRARVCL